MNDDCKSNVSLTRQIVRNCKKIWSFKNAQIYSDFKQIFHIKSLIFSSISLHCAYYFSYSL